MSLFGPHLRHLLDLRPLGLYIIYSPATHAIQMAAVAGHGGLVDVISGFGSHLCAFRCRGLEK
jgi:hypothetical protein